MRVAAFVLVANNTVNAALLLRHRSTTGQTPETTMNKIDEENDIAQAAQFEAQSTAGVIEPRQNELLSDMAFHTAQDDLEASSHVIPSASVALKEAQAFADTAQQHADHARLMAEQIQSAPQLAASNAVAAIEGRIRSAAHAAAVQAMTAPPAPDPLKDQRMMNAVAEAAEPYHLGLLRAQKFVAEAYGKAYSTATMVTNLNMQAKKMANDAVALNAAGGGFQARKMMTEAHAIQEKAKNMKAWASKFYSQADDINKSLASYQAAQSAAAAEAAQLMAPLPQAPAMGVEAPLV